MTVVSAMIDEEDRVWMASDSCISHAGSLKTIHSNVKMKLLGEILFGIAGDVRSAQIILNNFTPKRKGRKVSDLDYVQRDLIQQLKKCYQKHVSTDFDTTKNQFLIAYNRKLYFIDYNWAVLPIERRYFAIGSGAQVALGALTAYSVSKKFSKEDVRMYLEAATNIASMYISNVSMPVNMEILEAKTK